MKARGFSRSFKSSESGMAIIEYGLIAGVIAISIVSALRTLGGDVKEDFEKVANKVVENKVVEMKKEAKVGTGTSSEKK